MTPLRNETTTKVWMCSNPSCQSVWGSYPAQMSREPALCPNCKTHPVWERYVSEPPPARIVNEPAITRTEVHAHLRYAMERATECGRRAFDQFEFWKALIARLEPR